MSKRRSRTALRLMLLFRTRREFNYGLLLTATLFFVVALLLPPPGSLVRLVAQEDPLGYRLQSGTKTIAQSVNKILKTNLTAEQVADKAKIMAAILLASAFLWATEAIPLGATDLLVGAVLYLFSILPFDDIARAYMKDAVFFIAGVLTIALGVHMTGLDRRIGVLLLGRIRGLKGFCFVFLPALSLAAGFFSEHALAAILVPILVRVYLLLCEEYHIQVDRGLAILMLLGICFALNQGGPGSPAAGGRNAVMVGYLQEAGMPISFGQWIVIAMPYVLVSSLAVGTFMYFSLRRRIAVPKVDFRKFLAEEVRKVGPMSRPEMLMAGILLIVVALWIGASDRFGLGGPCVFGVVLMLIFRIVRWRDIQTNVRFDVVGLYAAACAIGVGLQMTGASLWLAHCIISVLPGFMQQGDMLVVGVSGFSGTLTNFMSDGATVAAIGPVAISMASLGNIHVWKVGLGCAFASSFANATIVGTPNNAIAYVGAVDPRTGKRLLRLRDFLIYGLPVTFLSLILLWTWALLGYWRFLPWLWK